MGNNFIANTPLGNLRVISFQGIAINTCHKQIQALLADVPAQCQLFAEPVRDEGDGSIDWYTALQGRAQRVDKLPEEEQQAVRAQFERLLADIRQRAEAMLGEGKEVKANILLNALSWPAAPDNTSCLYAVGSQPVLVCWGFQDGTGKNVSSEAIDRDGGRLAKAAVAEEGIVKPAPAPVAEVPPPAPELVRTVPQAAPVERKGRWWLWLLPLLLLLLLFGLWHFLAPMYPGFFSGSGFGCSRPVTPVQPVVADPPAVERPAEPETAPPAVAEPVPPAQESFLPWSKGRIFIDDGLADDAQTPVTLVLTGEREQVLQGRIGGSVTGGGQTCHGEGRLRMEQEGYALDFADGLTCPNNNHFGSFSLFCSGDIRQCQISNSLGERWPVRVRLELE